MRTLLLALVIVGISCTEWAEFQMQYNKVYASKQEAEKRMHIFLHKLHEIKKHNAGNHSWEMGINQFSDLTYEEFSAVYLMKNKEQYNIIADDAVTAVTPIDWRKKNAVTPVKDQKSCGSCYSFGAIGGIEGRCAVKIGKLIDLADQQCVDCSNGYGNYGCGGGWPHYCMNSFVDQGGVMKTADYPYTARSGTCKFDKNKVAVVTGKPTMVTSEQALINELAVSPLAVCLYATSRFQSYRSGIFTDTGCSYSANHCLVGVGLGSEGGQDYFIIKNSWGSGWGESGYIRFRANNGNQCGVGSKCSYPSTCR